MIDLKLIRNQLDSVAKKLKTRGFQLDVERIGALESKRRDYLQLCESLQMQRNTLAKEIGKLKKSGQDAQAQLKAASEISQKTKDAEASCRQCENELSELLSFVPNIPHESTPIGKDESENVVVRQVGEKPAFDFPIKDHEALTAVSKGIDTSLASELAGSRFVVLSHEIAQLNRALVQWMLDVHITEHGYTEVNIPVLTKPSTLYGTGQLPKFRDDLFVTNDERELMLIPTAEVQLVNLNANSIVPEVSLPLTYCSHSLCFRKEAGSYGKDTSGMFRVHQFEKVELVRIEKPDSSYQALEVITGHAENILKKLNLPYQVVSLCTGDLGFAATKTYDIEVWLPSQNCYREISSCSNTEDFQTRRIKTRYKNDKKQSILLHALNGSGVAVGRLLIAILENFQTKSQTVIIPEVLRPYMQQKNTISLV